MPEGPNYIGAGIAFPLRVNVQGSLQLSSAAPNLEESILIILRTELGERVYRPDFGSRLSELAFEPLNVQTLLLIRLHIEEALEMWEPRIILREVRTDPDPIRGKVDIQIIYQPKETRDLRSLVFPFYLSPAEE
ncbi:GPW/gp25 family protein [Leptolyngbya sp. FACHB-671]|uniref:GPW/gp25 family protein n=1 Tax=Leptolyngbya sp. FACHB-671 TaxID=2692812 RepID=UPI0016827005|nr:GPW/gp25 family protein [Leptolyngbya sp. FACHB-671]MBD1867170.1 GPW/gp25 family protein [Cyanobacteria bacterium FACHB-471]MBD2066476.1 GPW/gp25 family protein [Leptolyngbya sp. FACHB-671]